MKDTTIALVIGSLFILGLFGWTNNILLIAQEDAINGMTLLRCVGVIVAPLGALLGWI
jgi:hypothetical protein